MLFFVTVLGLRCFVRAFSSCGEWGYSLLGAQVSRGGGFSCCGAQALGVRASEVAAHGLTSAGTWS